MPEEWSKTFQAPLDFTERYRELDKNFERQKERVLMATRRGPEAVLLEATELRERYRSELGDLSFDLCKNIINAKGFDLEDLLEFIVFGSGLLIRITLGNVPDEEKFRE